MLVGFFPYFFIIESMYCTIGFRDQNVSKSPSVLMGRWPRQKAGHFREHRLFYVLSVFHAQFSNRSPADATVMLSVTSGWL